jgi:hypothetical protein
MPNKHIGDRRHHIPKMKFTVRNWAAYDAGLRRRGCLTLWVTVEAGFPASLVPVGSGRWLYAAPAWPLACRRPKQDCFD